MNNSKYRDQVDLLLEVISPTFEDKRLALKGGTAINLFFMDMPRLSVDLDLNYLPLSVRDEFMIDIKNVFEGIKGRFKRYLPEIAYTSDGIPKQIRLSRGGTTVKIEINLVLRGCVFPPSERQLCDRAQKEFEKSVIVKCVSFEDLFAGKFCAALDRQHPRDLFDVKMFFETYELTDRLKTAFIIYLISGNRPISEMIRPNFIDQRDLFKRELLGMTHTPVTYEELDTARLKLVAEIDKWLTADDRRFLLSVKKGKPQWDLMNHQGLELLPGVKWKLINIQRMSSPKRQQAIDLLKQKLDL